MKLTRCKTIFFFCALWALPATLLSAQAFKVLNNFDISNGYQPDAALVQGFDGNFYGTTFYGGPNSGCEAPVNYGCGTVFKVTPHGKLTTLHNFCSLANCADGSGPVGALTLGFDGSFYGTTSSFIDASPSTVFKITPEGKLTTLHTFCCAEGYDPIGGLVPGPDGSLYGTTIAGGLSGSLCSGCGTIFKITPSGNFTVLYSFIGEADGNSPYGLVLGADGELYGTTYQGGAVNDDNCAPYGCGTIFKITADGVLTTLYKFQGNDGLFPQAPLVQANDGSFFGTTNYGGGAGGSSGTVFKATPQGSLTTLYNFCTLYNCADGQNPTAALVQGTDGTFYGTTSGANEWGSIPGTIFAVDGQGKLNTLYSFCSQANCNDGYASAGLVQGTDGPFYGTAGGGGKSTTCQGGCGTIFKLSVGLGPFVRTVPLAAKTGSVVKILGANLTGVTSVSFDGVAATFTQVSSTEISATVPAGATTSNIQVTTPGGLIESNVQFRVVP